MWDRDHLRRVCPTVTDSDSNASVRPQLPAHNAGYGRGWKVIREAVQSLRRSRYPGTKASELDA